MNIDACVSPFCPFTVYRHTSFLQVSYDKFIYYWIICPDMENNRNHYEPEVSFGLIFCEVTIIFMFQVCVHIFVISDHYSPMRNLKFKFACTELFQKMLRI